MHFLKENKRIGEIPLSISLSLFSVIPRLFKIDRFSWNVRPWRRFVAFFDQCSWNVRPWRRFVAFFRSMFMEREALAGISPMRLFSFRECIREFYAFSEGKQTHWRNSIIDLSITLFSDPKTFQNRSIFMEREALAAFRSFFRSMFMEREALAAFRSFFFDQCSWNVRPWREFHQCVCFPSENASCQG